MKFINIEVEYYDGCNNIMPIHHKVSKKIDLHRCNLDIDDVISLTKKEFEQSCVEVFEKKYQGRTHKFTQIKI